MAAATTRESRPSVLRHGLPTAFKRQGTVYAIAFDMDIEPLRVHYGDPYNNAYLDIRRVRDIRMLRIEELNDLMPVVQRGAGLPGDE